MKKNPVWYFVAQSNSHGEVFSVFVYGYLSKNTEGRLSPLLFPINVIQTADCASPGSEMILT